MTDDQLLSSAKAGLTRAQRQGVVVVAWECTDPDCPDGHTRAPGAELV
jgi:hypothetical protein